MEESIIAMIAEAEQEAAARKAQAQEQAAEMVTKAEARAAEIAKTSEADCKVYREEKIKEAEITAASAYQATLEESRKSASEYADSVLAHADAYVAEIVGRLTK